MIRTTRVGAAAAKRRRAGGKLAVGRPSETRAGLHREREYVKRRARGWCELTHGGGHVGPLGWVGAFVRGTDFAHVVARSQGGEDSRFNALWLCRRCHDAMPAPYAKGRLLVTRWLVHGIRGFMWEFVRADSKWAFQRGEYETLLGSGFIRAELVDG
jgi:hypothetical protein